jgi:uncharacterized CHY-type Zn-finger protein
MKLYTTFSEYILNETLKTTPIDKALSYIESDLSLLKYDFSISKDEDNKIYITLYNVNKTQIFSLLLDTLNNILIDRHGWFPSKFYIKNINDVQNILKYDQDYLIDNQDYIKEVKICYEAKYDLLVSKIDTLYHLTIQQYKEKISKIGLVPKSKSKLSRHLDRIYLCANPNDCYNFINQMKIHYFNKKNINTKWIIYKIDSSELNIKLYKDPNYSNGYYCIDNINPKCLSTYDFEK